MVLPENSDLGRKVFFVNFSAQFADAIFSILRDNEIEYYNIESYKNAKNILRLYPDSICFICLDAGLSADEWLNFINSFQSDAMLTTISIGVMSESRDKALADRFRSETNVSAGFLTIEKQISQSADALLQVLQANNVNGRRKFIRADCHDEMLISADCAINNIAVPLKIMSISSTGISVKVSLEFARFFAQNMLVRDLHISLRNTKINCAAICAVVHHNEKSASVVFIFTQGISFAAKSAIREYVHSCLQRKIDSLIFDMPQDFTDYSQPVKDFEAKNITISINPQEMSEFENE